MVVGVLDSPLLQRYLGKSHFSLGRNLIQLYRHSCGKQPSTVIGKSYFTTVVSRPLLESKIEFLQQKFIASSCKQLSRRAQS